MGKSTGILKVTGQFDGLSFYIFNGKIIVRKTSGFEGKAIKTKANYVRTRENASEFGLASALGKKLRLELRPFLKKIHTPYLHNHVLKLFLEIMRCDSTSERGKRTVALGLQTEEGRQLLDGFEFNQAVPLSSMVVSAFQLSLEDGRLVFPGLRKEAIRFPEYATHIGLQFSVLWFDAEKESFTLAIGDKVVLPRTGFASYQSLSFATTDGTGMPIGLLFAEFLQEVNGEMLGLEGCGLKVVV